jgi:hypothetical protein
MWIQDLGWIKFESGIRDGKNSDPGSRINIPDPQHWVGLHTFEKQTALRGNELNTFF